MLPGKRSTLYLIYYILTLAGSDLADSGLLLLLGVRLRHDEGEDANSSEEDGDLHSDDVASDLLEKHRHVIV